MKVLLSKAGTSQWLGRSLLSVACLLACGSALAQSLTVDTTPPVIELEELVEGVADNSQVFTVQIAEDGELLDATLYHRRSGQLPYTPTTMVPMGTTAGFYTASLTTDPTDLRAIEYYIQARDVTGNRSVSGFAFDPFSRRLTPAIEERVQPPAEEQQPVEQAPSIQTAEPFYKKRWFQIGLGVVTVGVLASAMDSGDGDTEVVPVTFTLEP